jgi:hypothetical protein
MLDIQQFYHSSDRFFVLPLKNAVIPVQQITSQLSAGDRLWSLDGKKCITKNGLFKEFQTKMSFPNYFGKNWDAWNDCMGDLRWINNNSDGPKQSHFILIFNAERITELALSDRKIFLDLLSCMEDRWNAGYKSPRGVYKIIFASTVANISIVIDMLAESRATFTSLRTEFALPALVHPVSASPTKQNKPSKPGEKAP